MRAAISLEKAVDEYAATVGTRLVREGNVNDTIGLNRIVENAWALEMQKGVDSSKLVPQQAYAIEAMRVVARARAQAFLQAYSNHLQRQKGVVRFLKSGAFKWGTTFGVLVPFAMYNVAPIIAIAAAYGSGWCAAKITRNFIDRKAQEEKNGFERDLKAEFHRVAKESYA